MVNLFKIHGCVSQWKSIILTEDAYWNFFERRPNIANVLRAKAAKRSLLFVGHGLGDDDFDRIYLQVTPNDYGPGREWGSRVCRVGWCAAL